MLNCNPMFSLKGMDLRCVIQGIVAPKRLLAGVTSKSHVWVVDEKCVVEDVPHFSDIVHACNVMLTNCKIMNTLWPETIAELTLYS